ncbi:MAG: DUF6036 family nucleotidyltransferase [Tepidisphaeraceae bacterium]|jgi:uncharacterized nucleotidyltransferase DUF6036
MNEGTITKALEAVGRYLSASAPIELIIIGGAAGLLTGELEGTYTTGDVDALQVLPPDKWDELQDAAAKTGIEMGLPANWLNGEAGLYREALPADWKDRRVSVGRFGMLQVWAIGRLDLIAMKFYAHRQQDREHLDRMNVTKDELEFVLRRLNGMEASGIGDKGKIEMARDMVRNWL